MSEDLYCRLCSQIASLPVSNENAFTGIVMGTDAHLANDPKDSRNCACRETVQVGTGEFDLVGGLRVIADQTRGDDDRAVVFQGKLTAFII